MIKQFNDDIALKIFKKNQEIKKAAQQIKPPQITPKPQIIQTGGLLWDELLNGTQEKFFSESLEAEKKYFETVQRIKYLTEEGTADRLSRFLASLLIEFLDLADEHGENHNIYLKAVLMDYLSENEIKIKRLAGFK